MEKPDDLRKLAEWYRGMAEVGHTDDCGWRKRFAAYLDKRASELENHPRQHGEARAVDIRIPAYAKNRIH